MKAKHFLLIFLGMSLFFACEKTNQGVEPEKPVVEPPTTENPITKAVFSGYVQKGPFINGSSVMISLLDAHLNQTGTVFSTQIVDNSGNFEQRNMEFASNFVELKADGYYFNEVKGENSDGSLTLYALADITDVNSVNVNILTHLERQRIMYLLQNNGLSFSDAEKQARREVLDIFKFTLPDSVAAESLNITDNALLLAVSVIVQGQLSTGDLSELLANISSDIRTDGKLDNSALGSQLMNNVAYLDLDQVKSNMENKYSGLGINVNVNSDELKSYVEQFVKNSGFVQTSNITYPETGMNGPNVLADGFTEAKTGGQSAEYSICAVLPSGASLKVVIRNKYTDSTTITLPGDSVNIYPPAPWGSFNPITAQNWQISNYDFTIFGNTFTVIESGKPADACVIINNDCIVDYYENGALIPTKTKEITVIN